MLLAGCCCGAGMGMGKGRGMGQGCSSRCTQPGQQEQATTWGSAWPMKVGISWASAGGDSAGEAAERMHSRREALLQWMERPSPLLQQGNMGRSLTLTASSQIASNTCFTTSAPLHFFLLLYIWHAVYAAMSKYWMVPFNSHSLIRLQALKLRCTISWRCLVCCKNWSAGVWSIGVPWDPDWCKQTTLPEEGQKEKVGNNIQRAALFPQSDEYSIKQFGKQFIRALAAALYSSVPCTVFQ